MSNGTLERDEAIEQVTAAMDPDWYDQARLAAESVAYRTERFTTDAIWNALDALGVARPAEPRAMTAVVSWLVRTGRAERTGGFVSSNRPVAHRRPMRAYRSLIWHVTP